MLTVVAQTATDTMATAPADTPMRLILQMVILFAIFYFILIRPQQKRARQQIQMLESLKVGQEVIAAHVRKAISVITALAPVNKYTAQETDIQLPLLVPRDKYLNSVRYRKV